MGRGLLSRRRYGAAEGLRFLEPRFSRFAHTLVRLLSPAFLRFVEGVRRVEVQGARTLLEEYRSFAAGESRLIVAFRHPSASDAPVVGHLFARRVRKLAGREGVQLPKETFIHFLYGRGVPLWSGPGTGWLLPRVAAIPVYHRRVDSKGMAAVREAAVAGRFPIALAPEGQVTYHNKRFGELEAGTGRIALWCREDLRRRGEAKAVRLLPLAIEYRFGPGAGRSFDRALKWIEEQSGLSTEIRSGAPAPELYQGLMALTGGLLKQLERLYAPYAEGSTAAAGALSPPEAAIATSPGGEESIAATGAAPTVELPLLLRRRIEAICDTALRVGERSHGIPSKGSLLDRVFRLRDAGWNRMFRNDLPDLSPTERAYADAFAEQAKLSARHMELVDALEYLDPGYIFPEAGFDRFLEYALMLQDVVNRLLGGTIAGRMVVKGREAIITVGEPRSVEAILSGGTAEEKGRGGKAEVDRESGGDAGRPAAAGRQNAPGNSPAPGTEAARSASAAPGSGTRVRRASRRIADYIASEFRRLIR